MPGLQSRLIWIVRKIAGTITGNPKKTRIEKTKKHDRMYVVVYPPATSGSDPSIEFWSKKNAFSCARRDSKYQTIEVFEVDPDNYDLDLGDSPRNGQTGVYRIWTFPARKRR
jgi:hypothetical protein